VEKHLEDARRLQEATTAMASVDLAASGLASSAAAPPAPVASGGNSSRNSPVGRRDGSAGSNRAGAHNSRAKFTQ
jgi:hypothetical protein